MNQQKPLSRRHFTEAARASALASRRRKQEMAIPKDVPELFVVRRPASTREFRWEIRRFGAVVLETSTRGYPTTQDARAAGDSALSAFKGGV